MWKIIISPEFGAKLDLERTRDVVKQAERDLGTPLEWVAVTHFNTEHPHVHRVVRGRRSDGTSLTLPRAYVQHVSGKLPVERVLFISGPEESWMRSQRRNV